MNDVVTNSNIHFETMHTSDQEYLSEVSLFLSSFKLCCFCNKHLTRNQYFWWPSTYICSSGHLYVYPLKTRLSIHMYLVTNNIQRMFLYVATHLSNQKSALKCTLEVHNFSEKLQNRENILSLTWLWKAKKSRLMSFSLAQIFWSILWPSFILWEFL